MSVNKSIRIKTTPGESKDIQFKIEQDFDTIDFLSLSLTQEEIYRNFCSDYGVIAGRVIANDDFGVPNARISVFIPLSDEDAQDPVISSVYPYITPLDLNAENIRYNLLPRLGREFYIFRNIPSAITSATGVINYLGTQGNSTPLGDFIGPWEPAENPTTLNTLPTEITNNLPGYTVWRRLVRVNNGPRVPVGTFPSKMELLNDDTTLEVYEKYYKFTTKTNQSGDYMIFGVPVGQQLLHLDVDLSDIGNTSLSPQDFINAGVPNTFFTEDSNGNLDFQRNSNLSSLPQIETQNISVDVQPFWGNVEQCEIGITRQDFSLVKKINPSSILMFSCFGSLENHFIRMNNNTSNYGALGNSLSRDDFCDIQNQRQLGVRVYTRSDDGVYESIDEFDDGNVVLFIPMTKDRFITTESGSLELSNDPNIGVPTTTDLDFLVHPLEEFSPPGSHGNNRVQGYGFYETGGGNTISTSNKRYRLKFDLSSPKPRIYTIGQYNWRRKDSGLLTIINNSGTNTQHPEITEDREFFGTSNNRGGVRYGSLWFPRYRTGRNGTIRRTKLTNVGNTDQESDLFPVTGFKYDKNTIGIFGNRTPLIMDVTDVINLWAVFGGNLTQYTSKLDLYNTNPSLPFEPFGCVDLRQHTIPLRGTSLLGVGIPFPETLNTDDKPWLDEIVSNPGDAYINISFNTTNRIVSSWNDDNQETSIRGRYFFYWGTDPENSVLHELERRLLQ